MITYKSTLLIAGISGALAVGLGAFGAHGLETYLDEIGRADTYETAVKYHFYHSLLLLGLGLLWLKQGRLKFIKTAVLCCITGILIFSGSLYILCLTNVGWLGAITPIGGVLLILSWLLMGIGVWKTNFES